MESLKIAICDDNPIELTTIKEHCIATLKKHDIQFEVNTYSSGIDFFNSNIDYNLILLDIEMSDLNGIEIKEIIEEKYIYTIIIFISNHRDRMDDAYGKNVVAYIDKSKLGNLEYKLVKLIHDWKDDETILIDKNPVMIKDILKVFRQK